MHRKRRLLGVLTVGMTAMAVAAPAASAQAGTIFSVAGAGDSVFGAPRSATGDGGPATDARLTLPTDVAPLPGGGYLIADAANARIRRVSRTGRITTVAGTGRLGSTGDGGPARSATFRAPTTVAVQADGGYLIGDSLANRIRRVSPGGTITTVAGTGRLGFAGDGGPAVAARIAVPGRIAPLADGGFVFADTANHRIRAVDADGVILTIAGSGPSGERGGGFRGDGGPATSARLNSPVGVAISPLGILIADTSNNRIRLVTEEGLIGTVAGSGAPGQQGAAFGGDGRAAIGARLALPEDVEPSGAGGFYVVDGFNGRIRLVTRAGRIRTVAGRGLPDDGAADPRSGGIGDGGPARRALMIPSSVERTPDGGLLLTDGFSNRVRFVRPVRTGRLALALVPLVRSGPKFSVGYVATQRARLRFDVLRGGRLVSRRSGQAGEPLRVRKLRPGRYTLRLIARTRDGQIATQTTTVTLTTGATRASAASTDVLVPLGP